MLPSHCRGTPDTCVSYIYILFVCMEYMHTYMLHRIYVDVKREEQRRVTLIWVEHVRKRDTNTSAETEKHPLWK